MEIYAILLQTGPIKIILVLHRNIQNNIAPKIIPLKSSIACLAVNIKLLSVPRYFKTTKSIPLRLFH